MITLAFLQNLWVKDPERVRIMLKKRDEDYRRQVIRQLLFAGGLTGQRLRAAFGDLCAQIIWEEASREIAGDAKTICTPDPVHIRAVLDQLQPNVVIAFGRVAGDAVSPFWPDLIRLPHPAARQADTLEKLRAVATELRSIYGTQIN